MTLPPAYVDEATGCWLTAYKPSLTAYKPSQNGYVAIRRWGKPTILAHRLFYETLKGAIPEGLDLDHLCRNARRRKQAA